MYTVQFLTRPSFPITCGRVYCVQTLYIMYSHRFVRNRFLVAYYVTSLKSKYGLTTFRRETIQKKNINIIFHLFWKICIKTKWKAESFWFLFVLSLGLFHIEKIIWKFLTSISWSKELWKSYIGIPSVAQTNITTHTKREPHARLRNPFLSRKFIFEIFKIFPIYYFNKYCIL